MFGFFKEKKELEAKVKELELAHSFLLHKWNNLVRQINEKGGQAFLNGMVPSPGNKQFTDAELRSILQLVHPDKHGGKASAIAITQKINAIRNSP